MKILSSCLLTFVILCSEFVKWSAFAKRPDRGRGRGQDKGRGPGGPHQPPPGHHELPPGHHQLPPGHYQRPSGRYRRPPGHYRRRTIDQIIVDAYGGTDAVNSLAETLAGGGMIRAELDMNLTPQQYSRLYGHHERGKRKALNDVRARWPNNVIPYDIVKKDFTDSEITEIKAALAEWEKFTCIMFRQSTNSRQNRIRFQNGPGCNSGVGMVGGTQPVNLQAPGCRYKGLYLHEVGHAIGLLHEHQLPNRDDYINIDMANVAPGMRIWFDKYSSLAVDLQGVDYDYSSVMHYGRTAFSYDGEAQTIFTKDRSKEGEIGQVAYKPLSFSDVKAVSIMYNCHKHCGTVPSCEAPCFVNKDCKCFCKEDMPKPSCENRDSDSSCQEWAALGECSTNRDYMLDNCLKACGLCPDSQGGDGVTVDSGVPEDVSCENTYSDQNCTVWALRGECERNMKWMESNCRKACEKCIRTNMASETTAASSSSDGQCVNLYGDWECRDWTARGECQKNPNFMIPNCRQACQRCDNTTGGESAGQGTIEESTKCEDKDNKCASWSVYCFSNEYVINNCLKTCDRCHPAR